jgi:hypothetical protein
MAAPKFNIERVVQPAVVEGFIVTFTPEQLTYVVAVLGHTVRAGSIPRYAQGMYDALSDQLEAAGLIDKSYTQDDINAVTREDGVPYAGQLFKHLGLEKP